MYYVMLIVPWFATFAMTVQIGLWSNAILLAQVVLSGLVAFGFYQPLAILIDEQTDGSYTYFMDFLAIWALYIGTMLILKILDGALSKTKMKFQEKVDQFGGPAVGFVTGWIVTGIVMASLHAAPIPPETMNLKASDVGNTSRLARPDLMWLDLVQGAMQASALGTGEGVMTTEDYVALYRTRQEAFSEEKGSTVRRSGATGR